MMRTDATLAGGWAGPALLALLLLGTIGLPAAAQVFPSGSTLDDVEQQAREAAEAQREREARDRWIAQRAEENEDRWDEIERFVESSVRDQERDTGRRGESFETYESLYTAGNLMMAADLRLACGDLRGAGSILTTVERTDRTRPLRTDPRYNGELHTARWQLELIERYERWSSFRESTLERVIESVQGAIEEAKVYEVNQRVRDIWLSNITEFEGEVTQLMDRVKRQQQLIKLIQENTWDGYAMWELGIRSIRELNLVAQGRAWLEAAREMCPDHWVVRSGLVAAGIGEAQGMQGFSSPVQQMRERTPEVARDFLQGVAEEVAGYQARIDEANANGEEYPLTPAEKDVLDRSANMGEYRTFIEAVIRGSITRATSAQTAYQDAVGTDDGSGN